ncbi:methyl- -binding domain-containing 11-like [Olea europaea subsp. europaea]|uniref:Methyl- -binding domain-containing 11-like n=1 Tax=Olea europaea subsp. europaea TaxID=158383 RepID=A0A8S0PFZ8_OLEEU|nr:methyl- -binding domain-containing 11-like [Olea europaea subsp. europaea]
MENNEERKQNEVVAIELPAPPGWIKKFIPKKGGTPRRNDIVFTAPTGEEIKNKRQLDQYLKSHPEGPSAAEFDWGTGDTPRRSSRLSEKSKTQEVPEIETPKKKQKKVSEKKEAEEKDDADGAEGNDDKDAAAEETKGGPEVSMADAENAGDDDGGEFTTDSALPDKHNTEDEEPPAADDVIDAITEKVDAKVEEFKDATPEVAGLKVEESKNATAEVESAKVEEFKDATADVAGAKVEKSKDWTNEIADMKKDELKGEDHAEKELLDGKVNGAEAEAAGNDESKDNQEKENTP